MLKLSSVKEMRRILFMKEIVIAIYDDDLKVLTENKYSLCIAGRTSDYTYNVIWLSETGFSQNNLVKIENKYSVFASVSANIGDMVFKNIGPMDINIGEKTEISAEGFFNGAKTGEFVRSGGFSDKAYRHVPYLV